MNRNSKSDEIEARLERSLRKQVRVPRLDGRFDAAVWARIEKETAVAAMPPMPARPGISRWLLASNLVGVLVTIAVVLFFGAQAFTGFEFSISLPQVSPGFVEHIVSAIIWPVTGIALAFGLMFTSIGRRLRAEFF